MTYSDAIIKRLTDGTRRIQQEFMSKKLERR